MRVTLTALIAAIEAAAVALMVFVVIAIPGALLWWVSFGLAGDPSQVLAGVSAAWQLAHLVPIAVAVTPESALGFGLPPQELAFVVSMGPLLLTLGTAGLAVRLGWRFARRSGSAAVGVLAVLGGTAGFAAAAAVIGLLAGAWSAWPLWAAVLVPALWFGGWAAVGWVCTAALNGDDWWRRTVRRAQRLTERLSPIGAAALPARAREALRMAVIALAAVIGLGAVGVALAILTGYVEIVTLSQGLQLDLIANVLLFLVQVAVLPTAWIWAVAWFTGAGFGIGLGSSVTPFDTLLGPLPALPLLGALPQGWGAAGALAPALVVLAGVLAGILGELRRVPAWSAVAVAVSAAVIVGLAVVGLSALASGSIGPGRLAEAGPQPWLDGGLAAAEVGAGMLCGVFARRVDHARWNAALANLPAVRPGRGEAPHRTHEEPAAPHPDLDETAPLVLGDSFRAPAVSPAAAPAPATTAPTPLDAEPLSATATARASGDEQEDDGADALLRAYAWDGDPRAHELPAAPERTARWAFLRRRR